MSSAIQFCLNSVLAHGDTLLRRDSETCSLYVAEMPHWDPPEAFVLVECVNRTWFIVLLTDDISGWHWPEVRNAVVDYATRFAFMHPEVFQEFLPAFDSLAGKGDWDPITSIMEPTKVIHPLLLKWNEEQWKPRMM